MATTLIDTIEVKNISPQLIIVGVKADPTSPFFTKSGQIKLSPAASLEAENSRFDLGQLQLMQNNKVITVNKFRRLVDIIIPTGSTGSTGTA